MTDTVNNAIPLVPENTTDPAAGLNLAIDTIDALLQLSVLGIETAPPSGASDGDRYIVDTGATGDWLGEDGKIARYVATGDYWQFHSANYALNEADNTLYIFNGVNDWWEQSIPLDEFITNSIIVKGLVKDRDLTAPPGSPTEGDAYIPAVTATGDWAGHENEIAAWINGAWFFVVPIVGQSFWVDDEGVQIRWSGSSWVNALVGTVSQSAGVPTGAIIERGSNANGEYVKFADGTMLCFISKILVNQYSSTELRRVWTYPNSFISIPAISITNDNLAVEASFSYLEPYHVVAASSLLNVDIRIVMANSVVGASDQFSISVTAIGRWF